MKKPTHIKIALVLLWLNIILLGLIVVGFPSAYFAAGLNLREILIKLFVANNPHVTHLYLFVAVAVGIFSLLVWLFYIFIACKISKGEKWAHKTFLIWTCIEVFLFLCCAFISMNFVIAFIILLRIPLIILLLTNSSRGYFKPSIVLLKKPKTMKIAQILLCINRIIISFMLVTTLMFIVSAFIVELNSSPTVSTDELMTRAMSKITSQELTTQEAWFFPQTLAFFLLFSVIHIFLIYKLFKGKGWTVTVIALLTYSEISHLSRVLKDVPITQIIIISIAIIASIPILLLMSKSSQTYFKQRKAINIEQVTS